MGLGLPLTVATWATTPDATSQFLVRGVGSYDELMEAVEREKPDVVLTDIRMPPTHTDEGLRAAHRIRSEQPTTAVLVLSQYVEEGYALDLVGDSAGGGHAHCGLMC